MAATWTAKKGSAQFSRSGMVNSTRVVSVLHTESTVLTRPWPPVRGHLCVARARITCAWPPVPGSPVHGHASLATCAMITCAWPPVRGHLCCGHPHSPTQWLCNMKDKDSGYWFSVLCPPPPSPQCNWAGRMSRCLSTRMQPASGDLGGHMRAPVTASLPPTSPVHAPLCSSRFTCSELVTISTSPWLP